MKVGIVTNYHSTGNYGALLQAYALNKTINGLPQCECTTLDICINNSDGSKFRRYLKKLKDMHLITFGRELDRDFRKFLIKNKITYRRNALNYFRDSIPHTQTVDSSDYSLIADDFDILVCGSDQIWRPNYDGNLIEPYWLHGFPNTIKKVSYAASMGIESYPDKLIPQVKEYLKDFNSISVREQQAESYLKKISNRIDIVTVIDPVFLLDKNEWEDIADQSELEITDKYILVYMIHGNKRLLHNITEFAKSKGLKIVTFPYMSYFYRSRDRNFGDIHDFESSPNRFLKLIEKAEYIITDSFHATAFSIIFHKQFVASNANKKALSRLSNLLKKLNLSDQLMMTDGEDLNRILSNSINWTMVDMAILEQKNHSMKFLRKSILGEES